MKGSTIVPKRGGSLKRCLRKFLSGSDLRVNDGVYSVAQGGYDLWFQCYYNNEPIIDCICGKVEALNSYGEKHLGAVQEVWADYCNPFVA